MGQRGKASVVLFWEFKLLFVRVSKVSDFIFSDEPIKMVHCKPKRGEKKLRDAPSQLVNSTNNSFVHI